MTTFEKTLLKEVAALPETWRADVLAFVRYLKLSIPNEEMELEKRFDKALKSIRTKSRKLNITQADIDAKIRAVREENARHGWYENSRFLIAWRRAASHRGPMESRKIFNHC